ncbi:hypothetical protein [Nocardioides lijunqiniae]|uniref:hypothetical protein n=1 Tax=Nocardioides lijunqiniae TaxID=2760832 RepID=UPI001878609B|nr:hypothetical protein [Nocardioides lijunqiniae]
MQIEVMASSPTYGGAGSIDLVGEFLLEGLAPVGEAVERIEVDLLLTATPEAPRDTYDDGAHEVGVVVGVGLVVDPDVQAILDALAEAARDGMAMSPGDAGWGLAHEQERQKGPSLVFRRSARRVRVRVVSRLSELDVFGSEPRPATFATAAREIVDGLEPLRQRATKGDDLDVATLLAHLEARLAQLPETDEDLHTTLAPLVAERLERWAALSPWDVVDVDWSLYAPEARTLLDDPFFWDPADDEAPHGSDTGADVLAEFLDQRPRDPLAFLESQATGWGFDSLAELGREEPEEHDTLIVAAAFAQLKVTARIDSTLGEMAMEALGRRTGDEADATDDLLVSALANATERA